MRTQHYLVLDIGGTAVKYAVMDDSAAILLKGAFPSPKSQLDDFWAALDQVVEPTRQKFNITAIAISTCGAVDCETGVIHGASALPYIHGPNFKQLIQARYQLPSELENDACCAALAELWKGAAQQTQDCCLAVIGSGIGGAIVQNRSIHHGHQRHGGEFGYMIAGHDHDLPLTFSDLASTRGLVEAAAKALNEPVETLNGKVVFERNEQGESRLTTVIDNWYRMLAIGLFNIQYCIDPEKIILGGAISARPELLIKLNQHIDELMRKMPFAKIRPQLAVCQAGNDANLIGALYHYLNRQSQHLSF
ncbi:ROK family protein [Photobacterium sanctipauli]|uniref:ROK family protein n=1 Tax=Photobacterium sanctipauli TaxID=1342794 RepID=A0A2T3P100_9GAMM|nr:ROK family protein [Photobacterium sanctipauli]PSW22201.1 ROK family protein [Photobacterium sanctipauli]